MLAGLVPSTVRRVQALRCSLGVGSGSGSSASRSQQYIEAHGVEAMSTWDDKPNDYEHALRIIEGLRAAGLAALSKLDEAHICCREIECERIGPDAPADRDDSCRLHDVRKILAGAFQQTVSEK